MQVSEEGLDKFIIIYEEVFGEPVSRPDARVMASELLDIFKVTCRPIPAECYIEASDSKISKETKKNSN